MSHKTTDLFLHLPPERVLEAVEAAELRCRPLCYPLNSFENRVYMMETEEFRVLKNEIGGQAAIDSLLSDSAYVALGK